MVPTEDLTVAVRKQLGRLLADGIFDGQERQKQFLRFVVEETLAGRGSELKEMLIGVVVFGRGDGYDPRLDATVRVEATKLRKRLAEYYDGPGASDSIILTIPKGGYVPHWIEREIAAPSAPEGAVEFLKSLRRFKNETVMATIAIVTSLIVYAYYNRPQLVVRIPRLTRVTYDNGVAVTPAISQNGEWLAYASDRRGAKNLDLWVRPRAGGEPIRITDMPGDEHSPSFSSDGKQIVFQYHSEDGDSIYSVPSLGGRPPQLLVARGSAPRLSPAGNVLAFHVAQDGLEPHQVGAGAIFLMDAGGQPKQLCPFLQTAVSPVWSPDGEKILFLGYDGETDNLDWYVTPAARCNPVPTGFAALFKTIDPPGNNELPGARQISSTKPLVWQNGQVLFLKEAGGIMHVWTVGLDSGSGKVRGPAQLVTGGPTASIQPAGGPAGLLAFCVTNSNLDLYSVGVSTETGRVSGLPLRLTTHPASDYSPSLTRDGRWLAFTSDRSGTMGVWLKDLLSGVEQSLTMRGQRAGKPIIDPSGRWVDYQRFGRPPEFRSSDAFRMNLDGSEQQLLHEGIYSSGETANGEYRILIGPGRRAHVWDRRSRTMQPLVQPEIAGEVSHIVEASISPDEKSVALNSQVVSGRQIFVIPFRPGQTIERLDLTEITKREDRAEASVWSSDGKLLYYLSRKNEDVRIMAVQIENGKPKGEHQLVFRLDEPERKLLPTAFSVAANRLVFTVMQTKSEIWLQR